MESYDTLTEAIAALKVQSYADDFNMQSEYLECRDGACKLSPRDFQVDSVFRFEGPTDPADEAILYAISSKKYVVKGLLVNAYGIYSAVRYFTEK